MDEQSKWADLINQPTRLTCDRCGAKVTILENIGSGRCVCLDCVKEEMNQRINWAQRVDKGPAEIIKTNGGK